MLTDSWCFLCDLFSTAVDAVPDEAGRRAAGRILQIVQDLSKDDLVLCLISGQS